MAKTFNVAFNISGNLDGSLIAALQRAAQGFKNLGNAANSLNGKSLKMSQALQHAQALMKNVEAYKNLQAKIGDTTQTQAAMRLDSLKLLQQRQAEQRQLDNMRANYKRLQEFYRQNRKSANADFLKAQLARAREDIKAQTNFVRGLDTSYNQSSKNVQKLNEQLAQQRSQLAQLRTTIPSSNIAAAESALRSQIDQTTAAYPLELKDFYWFFRQKIFSHENCAPRHIFQFPERDADRRINHGTVCGGDRNRHGI